MKIRAPIVFPLVLALFPGTVLTAQVASEHAVALKNWPAPRYWQPLPGEIVPAVGQAAPVTTNALVFIAMQPCRVVDTRASQGFGYLFGPPSLSPGPARTFPLQETFNNRCPIPSTAYAYSLNVTVIPSGSLGYLILWPQGQPQPNAVTLDDITGDIRNNAAIVPAGSPDGGISAVVNANTDLVIDINGYYVLPDTLAIGVGALANNTTGSDNTAIGDNALFSNTTGIENTAIGCLALYSNMTGRGNTANGISALANSTTGELNAAIGYAAGYNISTGNQNLHIGHPGDGRDDFVARIGFHGAHTAFFAAGIYGVTTGASNAMGLLIGSDDQFGSVSSSRRFKEDIQDMGEASRGLLTLRPVIFRYRQPDADGSKPVDYGLIAEEVAEVYPGLVVKDKDGQIETVQYYKLVPLLLNELQKQHEMNPGLKTRLSILRQEPEIVDSLQEQILALQKALDTLARCSKAAGQTVCPTTK